MQLADLQDVLSQAVEFVTSQAQCNTAVYLRLEAALKEFLHVVGGINRQPGYGRARSHSAGCENVAFVVLLRLCIDISNCGGT